MEHPAKNKADRNEWPQQSKTEPGSAGDHHDVSQNNHEELERPGGARIHLPHVPCPDSEPDHNRRAPAPTPPAPTTEAPLEEGEEDQEEYLYSPEVDEAACSDQPDAYGDRYTAVMVKDPHDNRMELYDARELPVKRGDRVVMDGPKGNCCGVVMGMPVRCKEACSGHLLRKNAAGDERRCATKRTRETESFSICNHLIMEMDLPMKLVSVEVLPNINKIVFHFSSDGRVDFRALVRELAGRLKCRVEMHQIGVRDEARLLGGVAHCGLPLCCSTFLKGFSPVSIKMAKDQSLALNPEKVSGLCGRLMCCLVYEQETYQQLKQGLPKPGKTIQTPAGEARVRELDILGQRVRVYTAEGNMEVFSMKEIQAHQDWLDGKGPRPEPAQEPGHGLTPPVPDHRYRESNQHPSVRDHRSRKDDELPRESLRSGDRSIATGASPGDAPMGGDPVKTEKQTGARSQEDRHPQEDGGRTRHPRRSRKRRRKPQESAGAAESSGRTQTGRVPTHPADPQKGDGETTPAGEGQPRRRVTRRRSRTSQPDGPSATPSPRQGRAASSGRGDDKSPKPTRPEGGDSSRSSSSRGITQPPGCGASAGDVGNSADANGNRDTGPPESKRRRRRRPPRSAPRSAPTARSGAPSKKEGGDSSSSGGGESG